MNANTTLNPGTWDKQHGILRDAKGKFDGVEHAPQDGELDDGVPLADLATVDANHLLTERVTRMVYGERVEDIAGTAAISAASTAKAAQWWDTHHAQASYGAGMGEYPLMPEDNTPRMLAGAAPSGNRRTYRTKVTLADATSLRMPSKAAMNRFAAEMNGGSFRVPVTVDAGGRSMQGYVLVTKHGANSWSVQPLGWPHPEGDLVAEISGAWLEKRKQSPMPRDLAEVAARAQAREARRAEARAGVDLGEGWTERVTEHSSAAVSAVAFNEQAGVVAIAMRPTHTVDAKTGKQKAGSQIVRGAVSPELMSSFLSAESAGAFIRSDLMPNSVAGDEMSEADREALARLPMRCPKCNGAWVSPANPDAHECATRTAPRGTKASKRPAEIAARHLAARVAAGLPFLRKPRKAKATKPVEVPTVAAPAPEAPAKPVFDLGSSFDPKRFVSQARAKWVPGPRLYGEPGHTMRFLGTIGAEHTSQAYNPDRYYDYAGISGANGDDGTVAFDGLGSTKAASITRSGMLSALERAHRHNGGPSATAVLDLAARSGGTVELGGMTTSPSDADERVVFSRVRVLEPSLAEANAGHVLRYLEAKGIAFDGDTTTTVVRQEVPWRPGETAWLIDWS